MSELKQVKVDNWGIYFLQRLKHFFNRTDYCDLTLQFQDNAQLKVHRLVLSACTEYFELLERTCEMYEDCLVMPDDLQADVVVPIVNFMYTGQLEFKIELLEKLYQTSQIMNMPVLSKLLDAQRQQIPKAPSVNYGGIKHYTKPLPNKPKRPIPSTSSSKRSFSKAFDIDVTRDKHVSKPSSSSANNGTLYHSASPERERIHLPSKKMSKGEPRPTRYELPEELDTDNIYDTSFSDISYTSTPLMVHPETTKRYSGKKGQFNSPSSSKRFNHGPSTVEIVECKKVSKQENVYDDDPLIDEGDMFGRDLLPQETPVRNTNQLFDQILDNNEGPKVTIEAKNSKQASKLDHAKIISEVLKKYPHLVKSNKNIKLKLLDTPSKPTKKQRVVTQVTAPKEEVKFKTEPDYTYESEVLDSVKAAKLIAAGAENISGPWICLICGTPGRALHFTTYYKFRRHLVEVHNEKPVSNMCEYCGLKSLKRNYLLHHLYTKHGQKPPPQYHFPKCNMCNYIALNEGYLVKHKMTHADARNFHCNVCNASFNTSSMLLMHIQNTGHKYSAERKMNLQCVYCFKMFLREANLYAHLKTNHKNEAKADCIIEDSDEEKPQLPEKVDRKVIKYEIPASFDNESDDDMSFQLHQKSRGRIVEREVDILEKPKNLNRAVTSTPRQKILNSGFGAPIQSPTQTPQKKPKLPPMQSQFLKEDSLSLTNTSHHEEIIMIGETEYIMRDNQLIPKNSKLADSDQYILSDMLHSDVDQTLHTLNSEASLEFSNINHTPTQELDLPDVKLTKKSAMNQPIQIVVSNEEEYKALMNSNHSIIFDDPDSRKRLTVLTAPHDTTLHGATIDLDTTQTNEMMIIQDDYPLNVSEAVSGDNSNIVVVYSHQVGDPAKPYQLITSQALTGAQFVSTSAVLTRNYETVTTSAPAAVNSQTIDNQVNWPSNLEQNIIHQQAQVIPVSELQVLNNVSQVAMNPSANDISNNLEELTEVHILNRKPKVKAQQESSIEQMETSLEHNDQSENMTGGNTVVEAMENGSSMPGVTQEAIENTEGLTVGSEESINDAIELKNDDAIDQLHQAQNIRDTQAQVSEVQDLQEQHIPEEQNIQEQDIQQKNMQTEDLHDDDLRKEESTDQIASEEEERFDGSVREPMAEGETVLNPNEAVEDDEAQEPSVQEMGPEDTSDSQNISDPSFEPVAKEQITNLTSEWSEDDDEATAPCDEPDNTTKVVSENVENNPVELEESIENIQQEMEKQMTRIVAIEAIGECDSPPTQEDMQTVQEIHEDAGDNTAQDCPEKISSLLNDWEENDSREGNENDMAATTIEAEGAIISEIDEPTAEKEAPKKDDKIKSLVSDWDDEDEDDGTKE